MDTDSTSRSTAAAAAGADVCPDGAARRLIHCVVPDGAVGLGEGDGVGKEEDEVVIYWRPDCVFCLDLLLRLKWTRLRYRKVNIRKDSDARAFVRSVADGNETVSTVVVAGQARMNPSKRQLITMVREHAPHALDAAR